MQLAVTVTVGGQTFDLVVLDSYRAAICNESGVMNPLFTSGESRSSAEHDLDLIVLCVHAPVARVRLPPSGLSPKGDSMVPVRGWVAFPVHNQIRHPYIVYPEALSQSGKVIARSLPYPCC